MSLAYRQILRMAARAVNAVTGKGASALESAYMTAPLTTVEIGNSDFTHGMIVDKMLGIVGQLVYAYASVPSHPFRAFNLSQTAGLADGAVVPSVNSAARPIVGALGTVKDADDATKICKRQSAQLIESIIIGIADGSLKGPYYYYDLFEDRVVHTRTSVVFDVCTWDLTAELASVAADGNAPLPDACLPVAVAGLISELILDDEFVQQASIFRNYFESALADVRSGKAQFSPPPPIVGGVNV